jgi:DNA polymerase-4
MASRRTPSILHVDLDAFFVSMEVLRRPELRGLPVVVAGGLGPRGVVNTCSYEARRFGIRSAMPVSQARRLCPQAVYLASDWHYYSPASKQFHRILRDYTPVVEPAGADEAYLDVHGSELLYGDGEAIGQDIRRRVLAEIGITCSVGVSSNRLVSKVASDAAKPDGLIVVPAGSEAQFLAPRQVRDLPAIGARTAEVLGGMGIRTIGDLAGVPVSVLQERFGKHGAGLHARALGINETPVTAGRGTARSVSRETTFGRDEPRPERLRAVLRSQAERVCADLERHALSARTVTVKLRFPPFETLTRSWTSSQPLELAAEVFEAGVRLFERAWRENGYRPVRLIGLGVSNLRERSNQLRLGETVDERQLPGVLAGLRERFGDEAIQRAAELQRRRYGPKGR